jgi:uncharacterized protein (DUF1697 family)
MANTPSHVAFLRGINVGGKNKLPMAELVKVFAKAGCSNIRTYIQSGNVIFTASPAVSQSVPRVVAAAIAKRLGLNVPVVVRSADELKVAVTSNPFCRGSELIDELHLAFLADAPDRRKAAIGRPATGLNCGDAISICTCRMVWREPN